MTEEAEVAIREDADLVRETLHEAWGYDQELNALVISARSAFERLIALAASPSKAGMEARRIEAVQVTAADYNGHDWDGSPFRGYDTVPTWLSDALTDGRIVVEPADRDYAIWRVLSNDYGKARFIAEPGDWIVNFAGNLAVLSDKALAALTTEGEMS